VEPGLQADALADSTRLADIFDRPLDVFWSLDPVQRKAELTSAIATLHAWHFEQNPAYRHTVQSRGVGASISESELVRLLRPTAQTFKSYIELLGTPFPQNRPFDFLDWMFDQLSVPLPRDRKSQFSTHYASLEGLLRAIETIYADFGLEISTSSGTSGRSTIMIRDGHSIQRTVESFYLAFQRYLGMQADHRAVFIMPKVTRIAMAQMASFSARRVWESDERVHFTIPFPASPDQVRVRAGRAYRPGFQGKIERSLLHPFMNWMNEHYVTGATVKQTIAIIDRAAGAGEKLLLFGGWIHLHAIALELKRQGRRVHLAPDSVIGSGGGMKELYPFTPRQIRQALTEVFETASGEPLIVRDVYGMAEGSWAAMQCAQGNYHIPPWIYVLTLDDDNNLQSGADTTGLLSFFDPFGGGKLFPAFFRTADRARLVNGAGGYEPTLNCPCGEIGAYLAAESIQRVDLLDEAGCAATI
jgi:hypothetical protein